MKIKELHLRNIASIERADIDFEHGLNDAITRTPASIFLISGDTGAGKSVILDGIAMALYKKTPRTEGVANKTRNEFVDREGESISINSIEQYTRLGISEREDCYSEVVFEGNDGLEYRAKLVLGMSRGNTDKETGKRPLKHRSPTWMVKVGARDWERVEAKTGQPILGAVGLTFEQFGRMAMLAQGQFASFLTGDKKERESILEQLTNTEHFSVYGMAISNLFGRAKEGKEQAKQVYDTEKQHTLEPEEVERLTADQQRLMVDFQALDREKHSLEERLKCLERVEQSGKIRQQAQGELAQLETLMATEEYRAKRSLVIDWDATDAVRKHWKDGQSAKQRKNVEEKCLAEWKERFGQLAADEAFRLEAFQRQEAAWREVNEWLEKQGDREELYAKEEVLHDRWKQLREKRVKRMAACERLQVEEEKTADLQAEVQRAEGSVQQAQLQLELHVQQLNDWKGKRDRLKPQEVNEELETWHRRSKCLADLQVHLQTWQGVKKRAEELQQLIAGDEKKGSEAKAILQAAEEVYHSAREQYEQAQSLLATMQLSVEDTLKELRQRLHREHAATCPLCGQSLQGLMDDEEFLHLLSPLQRTEQESAERLRMAEKNREQAKGDYDRLKGTVAANRQTFSSLQQELQERTAYLKQEAERWELDLSQPLADQLEIQMKRVDIEMAGLRKVQQEVQRMQQELDRLDGLRKGLDEAKQAADQAKVLAEKKVDQHLQLIQYLQTLVKELNVDIEQLVQELSTALDAFYPSWQTDEQQAEQLLTDEAAMFRRQQKVLEEGRVHLERERSILASIASIRTNILQLQPDWMYSRVPMAMEVKDIHAEWTGLLSAVNTSQTQLHECERMLRVAEDALKEYYLQSGQTEVDLVRLVEQEEQVAWVRKYLGDREAERKSRLDAVQAANLAIQEVLLQCGVQCEGQLPTREELLAKREQLALRIQEVMEQLGSIKSRLEMNRQNVERLHESEQRLADAERLFLKWEKINRVFGGNRFRTLVQTYILHPLLNNANIYLEKITDRYLLTCTEENEQLSILVLDRYNKNQVRSVTVLSGGERFMISLALSLALSSLNRPDMNVNILFIDEGFGTLDEKNLDSVMSTLEKLQEIAGQSNRRVGIISHREELNERLPVQIQVTKKGEGRSHVSVTGCL